MVNFRLCCHKLVTAVVGFGWLLTVSVGFSRSLSTNVFSVSTSLTSVSASESNSDSINSNSINSNSNSSSSSSDMTIDDNSCCIHYKWLIVGGGIHGVGIAARLIGTSRISSDQLLVVDEHPSLLHSWKERTRATGMAFLRSSAGFHLDVPVQGLREFAGEYTVATSTSAAAAATCTANKKPPSKKARRKAKNHRNKGNNPGGAFVGNDYQRPALELFNDHCDLVVNKYGLDDSFFRGRVESIVSNQNHDGGPWKVIIRNGSDTSLQPTTSTSTSSTTTVSADNIVLAVGNDDPLFPEWAIDLASSENNKISHLLQISNDETDSTPSHKNDYSNPIETQSRVVAIIGGGISAVHKALQLTSVDNVNNYQNNYHEQQPTNVVVHIVSRHQVREQQFDTHQDWMMTDELARRSLEKGGKGLTERQTRFRAIEGLAERREVIIRERVPGTIPTYMTRAKGGLEEAISEEKIHWHVAEVTSASCSSSSSSSSSSENDGSSYQLNLSNGCNISVDEIILATGLGKRPPGHAIIHPLAEEAGLPLSPCGYPLVDESLQWTQQTEKEPSSSKIFVSGGLAELELGPSARNIAGARMAAERIARANR